MREKVEEVRNYRQESFGNRKNIFDQKQSLAILLWIGDANFNIFGSAEPTRS